MWITVPAGTRSGGHVPQLLDPERVELRLDVPRRARAGARRAFVRLPRTPSARIVTFARMSTPGSKADFRSPCLPIPRSPVRTPTTRSSSYSTSTAGKPGEHVDAFGLDEAAQPLHELVQRDDVVAVVGERRRRDRKPELRAACEEVHVIVVHLGCERRALLLEVGDEQPAARRDRGRRRRACARPLRAPSRAPRSPAARRPRSFCSCASRSAADIPAGPPPTISTSTSRVSRSAAISSQLTAFSSQPC